MYVCSTPNHGRNQLPLLPARQEAPAVSSRVKSNRFRFLSLPSPHVVRSSTPQQTWSTNSSRRSGRHILPGLRACSCPWCLVSLSLFPSYLPPLSSQAKSNVYCTKFAERNALSQVHLWVSRFLFPCFVQSRPVDHPICYVWLCLYRYETTPFSGTNASARAAVALRPARYFPFPTLVVLNHRQRTVAPSPGFRLPSLAG